MTLYPVGTKGCDIAVLWYCYILFQCIKVMHECLNQLCDKLAICGILDHCLPCAYYLSSILQQGLNKVMYLVICGPFKHRSRMILTWSSLGLHMSWNVIEPVHQQAQFCLKSKTYFPNFNDFVSCWWIPWHHSTWPMGRNIASFWMSLWNHV